MPRPRSGIADDDDDLIWYVPWNRFLAWFSATWEQGQHVAIVGPTGCGKTTLAVSLCRLRKWVLALDAKGGDDTLRVAGFTALDAWPPPRKIRRNIQEGKPARLVAGFKPPTMADVPRLRTFLSDVLDAAWVDGSWTIEIDELQIMTDAKMMGLSGKVEQFLVAARSKRASILSLYQAPAWVPTAASRQATWVFLFPTRDEDVIKSLAKKIGRPWREMQYILQSIPQFHCILAGLNPFDPVLLIHPEEI